MVDGAITRRRFMGNTAAVGLGVLAHPTFSAKVFGANDRLVMGIIGAGGMGHGHMENFKDQGVEWGAVCDVYGVNLDAGLEIAGPQATGYTDYHKLLDRKDIAVRTLHLANIAQRKKARAVLSEDGKTVSI